MSELSDMMQDLNVKRQTNKEYQEDNDNLRNELLRMRKVWRTAIHCWLSRFTHSLLLGCVERNDREETDGGHITRERCYQRTSPNASRRDQVTTTCCSVAGTDWLSVASDDCKTTQRKHTKMQWRRTRLRCVAGHCCTCWGSIVGWAECHSRNPGTKLYSQNSGLMQHVHCLAAWLSTFVDRLFRNPTTFPLTSLKPPRATSASPKQKLDSHLQMNPASN